MIQLIRLKWSNWFSYGRDNEIHFTRDTLCQILGDNGAGKSSIPLILEEVLYNKNSKKIRKADILNRNTEDKFYSAELDFSVDEIQYKLNVERRSTLKVKLFKDGEDISSHTTTNTYKTVESILGVGFDVFTQLIYQSTSSSLNFLTSTDATRKKFLSDLFQLDKYQKLGTHFSVLHSTEATNVSQMKAVIESLKKDIEPTRNTIEPRMELDETIVDESEVAKLQVQIRDAEKEKANLNQTNRLIEVNNRNIVILENLEKIDVSDLPTEEKDEEEHAVTIRVTEARIKDSQAQIAKMEALGPVCPTCDQDIDEARVAKILEEEKRGVEENKEFLGKEKTELFLARQHNKKVAQRLEHEKKVEEIKGKIDTTLDKNPRNLRYYNDIIDKCQKKIDGIQEKKKKISDYNRRAETHNAKMEVFEDMLETREKSLESSTKRLEGYVSKATNLEILKKVFGNSGLLAYKIENLTFHLHELINSYLVKLSGGRFTLAFKAEKDKLNVTLTDEGKEINIQALSSGELARVNCATLLGIRSLLDSISNARINLLILDEVINVLDVEGRQTLVEILWEEPMNTFLVSHAWTHPLLQKLEVRKENGFSTVNYD